MDDRTDMRAEIEKQLSAAALKLDEAVSNGSPVASREWAQAIEVLLKARNQLPVVVMHSGMPSGDA